MGASPSIGLTRYRGSLTNRGRQSAKGYPSSGGVFEPSHSGNLRPRIYGYSGLRCIGNFLALVDHPGTEFGSPLILRGRSGKWLRLLAGSPESVVASASGSSFFKKFYPFFLF